MKIRKALVSLLNGVLIIVLSGCVRSTGPGIEPWQPSGSVATQATGEGPVNIPNITSPRSPGDPLYTPTPDSPHPVPGWREGEEQHTVQAGETLGLIAQSYNVSIQAIAEANEITDIHVLSIGQVLTIPAPPKTVTGPNFKIIPDSELVASPATASFEITEFVKAQNGYLMHHQEEVNGNNLWGYQIIKRVAREYSINPRILLAVLEYQSKWVTNPNPRSDTILYPMGWHDTSLEGLYLQISWTANNLNRGYTQWRQNQVAAWTLADAIVPIDPTINAGTAGVQYLFSLLYGYNTWEKSITSEGFFSVYQDLFGYPFDYTYDPIIPDNLVQPVLQLPFEKGVVWAFTGGPHGAWGNGAAWGALDFSPFVEERGCFISDEWVVAMADGLIVRAEHGAVVQDLDSDGKEQTGWTLLYMHIETRDRVQEGTYLKAGERIGHPSCEGGFTNGTHTHIARRYNGEWIPAELNIPFNLDGWVSSGTGSEYDGYLQKGTDKIEAFDGTFPGNEIKR
jgi:LasA protease